MNALEFRLKLIEPVLIANPVTGDENSAAGLSYIPGSVMRGALVQRYTGGKPAVNEGRFNEIFFAAARYLNAYPLLKGKRALPAPFSWRRKYAGGLETDSITDLACLPESAWQDDTLKRFGDHDEFCLLQAAPFLLTEKDEKRTGEPALPIGWLCAAGRSVDVHIFQKNRRTVSEGDSSVFRYEAIAAGEVFAGAVLSEDMSILGEVEKLLQVGTRFRIGKSRSAGYGLVEVIHSERHANWREAESLPGIPGGFLVVTLLSDAIVRDDDGVEAGSIQSALGAWPERVFARTHVVGGFNLTWGLPLPQARAISGGSVFVFTDTPILRDRLERAQSAGIGERRTEGYGRIAVNWHGVKKLDAAHDKADAGKIPLISASRQEAERMVERMWRVKLEDRLARVSQSQVSGSPNNAQLSRVRVLVREALRRDDPKYVLGNLSRMRKTAKDQFMRAKVNDKQLLEWIEDVASHPEQVEIHLRLNGEIPPVIGEVTIPGETRSRMQREFALRLIDGVLRHAAKEGDR